MKTHFGPCAISVAAGLLLSFSAGLASDAGTPEQFLTHLYAQYVHGKNPIAFDFPDAKAIVDDSMLELLKRDRKKAGGEVGALDYDPICSCQDWERIEVVSLSVVSADAGHAVVNVTFRDKGVDPRENRTARFELARVQGVWKIHDIGTKDTPSLQTMLRTYKY